MGCYKFRWHWVFFSIFSQGFPTKFSVLHFRNPLYRLSITPKLQFHGLLEKITCSVQIPLRTFVWEQYLRSGNVSNCFYFSYWHLKLACVWRKTQRLRAVSEKYCCFLDVQQLPLSIQYTNTKTTLGRKHNKMKITKNKSLSTIRQKVLTFIIIIFFFLLLNFQLTMTTKYFNLCM